MEKMMMMKIEKMKYNKVCRPKPKGENSGRKKMKGYRKNKEKKNGRNKRDTIKGVK